MEEEVLCQEAAEYFDELDFRAENNVPPDVELARDELNRWYRVNETRGRPCRADL